MAASHYFMFRLLPPRPDFAQTLTDAERRAMLAHRDYWAVLAANGTAIVLGPVLDPAGTWGLGVVRVADPAEVPQMLAADPAITAAVGLRYETFAMAAAIVGAPLPTNA